MYCFAESYLEILDVGLFPMTFVSRMQNKSSVLGIQTVLEENECTED